MRKKRTHRSSQSAGSTTSKRAKSGEIPVDGVRAVSTRSDTRMKLFAGAIRLGQCPGDKVFPPQDVGLLR